MEELICNPLKGRLETINVKYNEDNTTWLDDCSKSEDIYRITDTENGLLIKKNNYSYPVLLYDIARADIGNDQHRAKKIIMKMQQEFF